ncbi:MAG: hypothetical protein J5552_07220 [Prevotella sp.]|nr:hypothetical protein [Prevotella sp.]
MKRSLLACAAALLSLSATAQSDNKLTLGGSVQSDILLPQSDKDIGATKDDDLLTNTYVDLRLHHRLFEAGARLEYLEHPLPGFENDFKGWGVPHFYVRGHLGRRDDGAAIADLTAGTFYEQFGSGFILRTYEERSLGIDNSLLGARLVLKPMQGVTLKALGGKQRHYWDWNHAFISGADVELTLSEWIPSMRDAGTTLALGASWVNKNEKPGNMELTSTDIDSTGRNTVYTTTRYRLNQPRYVNAFDLRASLNTASLSMLAEYALKSDDPSFANGYIYKKGTVAMLSGSYSRKGLSLLLQAKRSENMAFKSDRTVIGTSSAINHLPAFTQDQTYALAALYPYATQLADGEWAYQAELGYNFKRKTPLGGRYGMNLKVNYSYVRAIDRQFNDRQQRNAIGGTIDLAGTSGYTSKFFKWGDNTYYQDLDITLSRKLTRQFNLSLMYMNQRYNKTQVEGHGGMIHSNIFVADGKYQFAPKTILRMEAQYLQTKDDEGDWVYGLAELSLAPHWMFTVSDMWNCGDSDPAHYADNTHHHYYQALVTYNNGSHRLQAGYGRTRAGYNCSGGVCRWIPAQKGFTLSYNYSF